MLLRIAEISEFEIVKNITVKTIVKVYPHYYPKGSVEFFLGLHNDEAIHRDLEEKNVYLISLENGIPIGTVTLNQNEINRFFVLPEFQHQGYGTKALDVVEQLLFHNYDCIQLHAALPGKMMYIHRGYKEIEFRKKEVSYGDWLCIDIMEKVKE